MLWDVELEPYQGQKIRVKASQVALEDLGVDTGVARWLTRGRRPVGHVEEVEPASVVAALEHTWKPRHGHVLVRFADTYLYLPLESWACYIEVV